MSEIFPLDERESPSPSQDDIKSMLASLALLKTNAEIAYECIEKGAYEHRDLQPAIKGIREGVPDLVEKLLSSDMLHDA